MTNGWNLTVCGQPEEWAQDQRWTKGTITGLELKTASRKNGQRKGMSGTLLLQAFLLGGCHTATHTRGQPKVWSNHRLLNALNIGGLIGSVEKGSPDSERMHTHAHKISLLHLPNYLATVENKRKLLTAQIGLTVNQPFSRQSKIVGQNSPQGQNKLRLSKGFLTFFCTKTK